RNTPAAAWDEGADTSRGADGRRRTPPVPGHERATPVPPAAPARAGRLVDPGPEVIDSADLEPLSDDSGDAWGDTAPPIGAGASDSPDEGLPDLPEPADRYAIGDEIGRGGMGLILEARDLALDRPVALKLLHDADQKDPALRLRFMDEARVTGQLQHPGVPPVYDLGRLGDGRLFFAMKRIEGRTLRDVIEDLREQDAETTRLFGRVRLLTLFAQICRAMAYAHSRGVMHRDLKPDNVMLGEFGEVTVMDWGLAKPIGGDVTGDEPIATARETESRFQTLSGEVTGTPQYMAPEQAAGRNDKVGAHSDIYSLGALLYELLTLEPPFDGPSLRVVRSAVLGDQVVPPSRRAPDRDIPFAVEQLCLQCLSKDPGHRPRSAAAVADQIERFLEGEQDRARREAERKRLLEAGTEAAESYYSRFEQQRQLQAKTAKMRAKVAPWAPVAERSRLWNQEDAEMAARIAAAHSLSEALVAYHAALEIDREHPAARRALCSLYYSAFETAERDDDKVAMALYEQLVRAFDDEEGFFSDRLKGDGRFELQTLPAGVTATLYSYRLVDRVLTPVKPRALGLTPAVIEPMPMGSYLLKLHAPGLAATAVPVYISRQERLRLRLRLFPDHARGADFVHVAFGPARLGGDPHAQLARPARTQEVDDFFIARRPVSAAQYREFLHALLAADGPTIARARAPRETPNGPPLWPIDLEGRFIIPDEDAHGMPWHPDWPVVNVSFEDAEAYCQWLDTIEGPGHRLPTEVEWEKAARGADGRLFPWGDTWEPTFCHMGISRPGPPARGAGGAFATDVSPYGVEDLAGGVSEWTSTWMEGARQRVIKGGHWASGPTECRAASRFTQAIDRVLPTLGFRVARSAPT
ncbi:MAG: SUMF1/EgtB/PvdO family nonheme iron enzyme, partial [Myxococcales bacterium]|nr:SUMF1/EgtB/PvdO family nonheme iron enzyme [Myxococcales bacterium]